MSSNVEIINVLCYLMYPHTPAVMTRDRTRRTVRRTTGTSTFGWDNNFEIDRGDWG